jgi:hypothetical protein
MYSRLRNEPILTPTYRLNKFSYTFKLNQRVKAAGIIKGDGYSHRKIFLEEVINNYKFKVFKEPVEVEKFVNRECYPPIPAIRRWIKWVHTKHIVYCIGKCYPCDLKKSSLAQAKLLSKTFGLKD